MKKTYIYIGVAMVVVIIAAVMMTAGGNPKSPAPPATSTSTPVATATSTNTGSNPATAQNAEDVVPGIYPNPINNSSTKQGFKVSSIMTENNVDAAGNSVSDHLQFTLQNLTAQTISNFEVYYTIVDAANNKKEGYYKQLTGFSLPPHGSGTVHFDGQSGPGHYGVNMHGIYGTTVDQLQFNVEISAPGYAPVNVQATKAPGGAEVVGQ